MTAEVRPCWLDARSFWYRRDAGIVSVDCETGKRRILATPPGELPLPRTVTPSPTRRTGSETAIVFSNPTGVDMELFWLEPGGGRRSYGLVEAGAERRQHTYGGHRWLVVDPKGGGRGVFEAEDVPARAEIAGAALEDQDAVTNASPDGRYAVRIVDHDVELTRGGRRHRLSRDGHPGDPYLPRCSFSPDSKKLVVIQCRPAEERKLRSATYLKPGDRIAHERPRLFDLRRRRPIPISEALWPNPWEISHLRWEPSSSRFTFLYNQRGHQLLRLIAVDAESGEAETLIEEQSATFIDYANKLECRFLEQSREILWMSERDGHNHLYLFDAATGAPRRQLTAGAFCVRSVEHVDEERRQVWFMACGLRPGEDPYHRHLCRVSLDGGDFVRLTEGDGTHRVDLSPDRGVFVDVWSRADKPPVAELRRADGTLVVELERAAIPAGQMPERFVAKGRDGTTDIHGIIIRPTPFDPSRRYPIIEEIYAGPQGQHVPKRFGPLTRQRALADRGFVVVQIDGMGTNWRSRAFQEVAWQNLEDSGFPDRKPWIRAAAETRPWMDLERVGIYGGSAGGQSAVRALIDHHDLYRVAVADCGCHDNRLDKIWWNELWLGWPVGPAYDAASNIVHAHRLRGRLLLIVGELDDNVDPICTLELARALERAGKDFELVVMKECGHGAADTPEGSRHRTDFFLKHL